MTTLNEAGGVPVAPPPGGAASPGGGGAGGGGGGGATGPVAMPPDPDYTSREEPAAPMMYRELDPKASPYVTVRPIGEPLVTIHIEGRNFTIDSNFARIDYDHIDEQAADCDNEAMWVAILANRAERRADELDLAADVLKAKINQEIGSQAALRPSNERPTVDQRKAMVEQDPRVIAAKHAHLVAKEQAANLKDAKYTLVRMAERITSLSSRVISARLAQTPYTPGGSNPMWDAARDRKLLEEAAAREGARPRALGAAATDAAQRAAKKSTPKKKKR